MLVNKQARMLAQTARSNTNVSLPRIRLFKRLNCRNFSSGIFVFLYTKLERDGDDELQIDNLFQGENLIRVRVYSKFRSQTKHQTFIFYILEDENRGESINKWLLQYLSKRCQNVITYAHAAGFLWYSANTEIQDVIERVEIIEDKKSYKYYTHSGKKLQIQVYRVWIHKILRNGSS